MNIKKMCLITATAAFTGTFAAQAQIPIQTEQTPTTTPTVENSGEQVEQVQRVRVRVVDIGESDLETKMENLSVSAIKEGLGQMSLNGFMSQSFLPNGTKKIEIVLNEATLKNEEKGKTTRTTIEKPFKAQVIPNPEIQINDQFDVEVDPIELLAAFQRLQEDETLEDAIEEEKEEQELKENEGGKFADSGNSEQDLGVSPNFEVAEEAENVISTELCEPRIDLEQLAAVQQERTIINGNPEPCTDTLTRYPLQKRFTNCPVDVDIDSLIAYPQFEYYYETSENGIIIATTCERDQENPISITESFDGCGINHNFTANVSNQQSRLIYTHNGVETVVRSCQDSANIYAHTTTQDGCDPVLTATDVTFQDRIYITINGIETDIRACAPDPSTTVAIQVEECTGSDRYTHDFLANQSRLNETFYYTDNNGDRQDIATCIAGTTTFAHMLDQSNCTPAFNDVARESTYRSQTFIDDNGTQVTLTGCEDELPSIPYVQVSDRWLISSQNNTNLIPQGSDITYYNGTILYHGNTGCMYNGASTNNPNTSIGMSYQGGSPWGCYYPSASLPQYSEKTPLHRSDSVSVSGNRYCLRRELENTWQLSNGIIINQTQSNDNPYIYPTVSFSGNPIISEHSTYVLFYGNPNTTINYSCNNPTCLHTHLRSHPVYLRADNSEYINISDTTGNLNICGDGSHLNGQDAI